MQPWAAVGQSTELDAIEAGRAAAAAAVEKLGGQRAGGVIVFGGAGYDQAALLKGVSAVTGDAPLAGCSAEGVITRSGSNESGRTVAVMVFAADRVACQAAMARGVGQDASAAGAALASAVKAAPVKNPRALLLFPDGLTANCTRLLAALRAQLPFPVLTVGGTAGDMMRFERTHQYCNGTVASDSVAAMLIGGDFAVDTELSHGCELVGDQHRVTQANNGFVEQIDGKPAWDVFRQHLLFGADDLRAKDVPHLAVGELLEDQPASGREFVVRVPLQLNKANGALFFAGELKEGTEVQMARRDPVKVREGALGAATRMAARHPGKSPVAMLQFDCVGRGRILLGEHVNKLLMEPLQGRFDAEVPWLGFHTFGEIGPLGGEPRFHGFSMVLCGFYA